MGEDYCENFTGGKCKKCNIYVPRSWCIKRCHYGKNIVIKEQPKTEVSLKRKKKSGGCGCGRNKSKDRLKEISAKKADIKLMREKRKLQKNRRIIRRRSDRNSE